MSTRENIRLIARAPLLVLSLSNPRTKYGQGSPTEARIYVVHI